MTGYSHILMRYTPSASRYVTRYLWGNEPAFILHREFRLSEDMYAQDSIELLKNSGIDFHSNEARGIDVHQFGSYLMTSGIVLNDEVRHQHQVQNRSQKLARSQLLSDQIHRKGGKPFDLSSFVDRSSSSVSLALFAEGNLHLMLVKVFSIKLCKAQS